MRLQERKLLCTFRVLLTFHRVARPCGSALKLWRWQRIAGSMEREERSSLLNRIHCLRSTTHIIISIIILEDFEHSLSLSPSFPHYHDLSHIINKSVRPTPIWSRSIQLWVWNRGRTNCFHGVRYFFILNELELDIWADWYCFNPTYSTKVHLSSLPFFWSSCLNNIFLLMSSDLKRPYRFRTWSSTSSERRDGLYNIQR